MPEISIFDARLAEIDRRLRNIQTGLAEDLAGSEPPAQGDRPPAGRQSPPAGGQRPPVSRQSPSSVSRESSSAVPASPLPPRVEVPDPGESVRAAAVAAAPLQRPVAASSVSPPRQSSDAEAAELIAGLRQLTEIHQQLIESMRGVLSAYEEALGQLGASGTVSVSAGPLANVQALRAFAETLERLPAVRDVEVRGYEGGDRAIVDVHLLDATS